MDDKSSNTNLLRNALIPNTYRKVRKGRLFNLILNGHVSCVSVIHWNKFSQYVFHIEIKRSTQRLLVLSTMLSIWIQLILPSKEKNYSHVYYILTMKSSKKKKKWGYISKVIAK